MFINLLISTQIIYYTIAEVNNGPIFDQPEPNSSQHIWHSYKFNTGAGNREELYFSNVDVNRDFESISGVFAWKSIPVQQQVVIVGLSSDVLSVTTLNEKNKPFTYKEELKGTAKALSLFQKWNAKTQGIDTFAVVAICMAEEKYILKWYQILNRRLKFLTDWPFYGNITHLEIIKINYESKLLIVNHKGIHKNPSAEIYNFDINHDLDIWLFEKIILDAIPSTVTVFDNNDDNTFFCASFPSLDMIHIFKYTKSLCLNTLEEKHFVSHQKVFSNGLKSVMSFRVGFRWYLAVASRTSLIYFIGENLLFQPINSLKLGGLNHWLVVPIDTYREDSIILADKGSDVSVITWTGDEQLEVIGSLSGLTCGNDSYCLEKMQRTALNESTAFEYSGHQNVIISTKNGSPLFLRLIVKLKPLPDKVTLKLQDILNMKRSLEKNYISQNEQIGQLMSGESASEIESIRFSNETFDARGIPEAVSQTKNLSEIMSEVNQLKETIETLNSNVEKLLTELKTNVLPLGGQNSSEFLKNNVTDGITFYGDVLINELNLSTLNGYNVNELLADSFRKNKMNKIGGKKTLKYANAENVIFEKIGDTLACDIVFSDDLWDEKYKNIINGDIIWEGKLNILNDVIIVPEASSHSNSSSKISRRTPKLVYDVLNLEDLEVTADTYIQRTINGKPFILPVHGGPLNILDIVNQARIEVVNVKGNLDVGIINGKNFSKLLENMQFKPPAQRQFDKIKVDGVFSAPLLQTNRLNSMNLSNGTPEFDENEFGQKLTANDPNFYVIENNLKSAPNPNLRRVIHVFQNLEVDGVLFSKKINNISWTVLNDTVKKNEKSVTLTGTKKFEKILSATKTNLSGALNGRFVENILNNFSDQIIRFPQVFESVNFKNLSLHGVWDGVSLEQLNKSVVRLSSNNGQAVSLTFEQNCFMNVLNVTDFVNAVNVRSADSYKTILKNKVELKSIKASGISLHGSLVTNNNINNVNLSNFSMLRVSLKSPETIDQGLIHPNVTVFGDLNLETLNLNDVSSIINSGGDTRLIEKFLNGEISRIKKLLVKGNISSPRGVNGFNVTRVIEKGVSINKPTSIKGNITFENIIYFDNVNVTGSIDGFSLKQLERDIAFKHSHVFLNGPKNFSTLKVAKNMKARTLNGHLVQDVVSLKGDETMKGPVQINGDVIVRGNVTSYAAINNVTVVDLLRTFSTKFNSFIYSGDLILRNDHVTVKNLAVSGNIQNVSLESLIDDAVLKESSFGISGKKFFKGEVKFKENISVKGLVHGVNFTQYYPDVIFINKPTKFKGTIIIKEAVLKVLETKGYFNSTLINNFDTNDWLEDSIHLDRYEVVGGKKIFESVDALEEVTVDFINNHLPTAMIPLKTKQFIPTKALFPRIHAISDLSVAGTVNGKNLMREYEDTVLTYGDQTIRGRTKFDNEFVVNGNLFVDTLKGKPVNSLITLDSEQIIKTPLEFKGLVTAKKDIEKLKIINNISLSDWSQNSVSLNREQVLNGLWTVKGKVKAENIEGDGLIHATVLPDISKDVRRGRLLALEKKYETEKEFSDQCRRVEDLSKQFSKLPYLFNQFEIADEIETSSVIDSVITFKVNEANYLIVTFVNECLSILYKWNRNNGTYDYLRQINIGSVSKWSVIYRYNATYLITSSLRSRKTCEENLKQGNVWIFKDESEKYTHLLTTSAFVEITHENDTSDEFFTIDESGILQQWTLEKNGNISSKFLLNIGPGNYRFIDFRVMGGLAITDGREIKQITLTDDKVIENNLSFINSHIVPLPIEGKILIGVVGKDKIVIYENLLDEKIFSVIHTHRAGSVLWFNYGPEKQTFLIVGSHHKLIEVYEYKSVSGMVKVMSIHVLSSRLQSETLPTKGKYQSDKFLIVVQKKKLILVKADMLGDFYETDSFC